MPLEVDRLLPVGVVAEIAEWAARRMGHFGVAEGTGGLRR